jgi:hypothetical protein
VPVSTSSIAAPADIAKQRAEGYAEFRRIIGGYAEPFRPSVKSVAAAAGMLERSLAYSAGQDDSAYSVVGDKHDVGGRGGWRVGTREGQTHRLSISPGVIRRRSFDAIKAEKSVQKAMDARLQLADQHAARLMHVGLWDTTGLESGPARVIVEFSAKSRARLVETVASLDYSAWNRADGDLAMVTLTLPGDWQAVAPSGGVFKRMLEKLRLRWRKAVDAPWRSIWKLEFQRRGAPHWHALMRVPVLVKGVPFHDWLSKTWADVVGASKVVDGLDKDGKDSSEYIRHLRAGTGIDFSGEDFSDPRRISMYFLGHSTKNQDGKEYQHIVPEEWRADGSGPGRFWGYTGLEKAVVEFSVTEADKVRLDRVLRKIKRARDWKMNVKRVHGKQLREGGKNVALLSPFEIHVKTGRGPVPGRRGRYAHRTYNLQQLDKALTACGGDLDALSWSWAPRVAYAPFSRGQGGFVMVNDALALSLEIGRWLRLDGLATVRNRAYEPAPRGVAAPLTDEQHEDNMHAEQLKELTASFRKEFEAAVVSSGRSWWFTAGHLI